jgi:hypothetical protein
MALTRLWLLGLKATLPLAKAAVAQEGSGPVG